MFFITTYKNMSSASFNQNFCFYYERQTSCQFNSKHIFVNFIIFLVITNKISAFIEFKRPE